MFEMVESLANFQSALINFDEEGSSDYSFFVDLAVSSLTLSNIRSLTIPGSKLNESGSSSTYRLNDKHTRILTKAVVAAGIHLEILSLCNHNITDKGFESICSDIVSVQRISRQHLHLNLEGNEIAGNFISELLLQSEECPLISLNLSHNPLTTSAGMTLADALRTNRTLQNVELNNCGFELNVIIAFGTTLRQNNTLKTLNLGRPLTDKSTTQEEGVDHISRLLASPNTRIEELCLRYHCVGDLGARLVAASLRKNRSLIYLDLERNQIGSNGCEALASYLLENESNNCLQTLLLSYNRVGNEGAKAIADVLQSNVPLKQLSLKNNDIKEGGLIVLALSLRTNTHLQCLELFGNKFTDGTGQLFSEFKSAFSPDLQLDIEVYEVDGQFLTAEIEIEYD